MKNDNCRKILEEICFDYFVKYKCYNYENNYICDYIDEDIISLLFDNLEFTFSSVVNKDEDADEDSKKTICSLIECYNNYNPFDCTEIQYLDKIKDIEKILKSSKIYNELKDKIAVEIKEKDNFVNELFELSELSEIDEYACDICQLYNEVKNKNCTDKIIKETNKGSFSSVDDVRSYLEDLALNEDNTISEDIKKFLKYTSKAFTCDLHSEYESAILNYKKALEILPKGLRVPYKDNYNKKDFDIYQRIAYCYEEIKQTDNALFYYKKAIECEDSKCTIIDLAWKYFRFGNINNAFKILENEILNATNANYKSNAYYKRALMYFNLKDYDNVLYDAKNAFNNSDKKDKHFLKDINNLIEICEEYFYITKNIKEKIENKKYSEVIEECKDLLDADNYFVAILHYYIGVCYINLDMYEEAMEAFELSIHFDTEYAPAYYNIGFIYEKQEEYDKAKYYYKKALSYNHDLIEAKDNLERIKQYI